MNNNKFLIFSAKYITTMCKRSDPQLSKCIMENMKNVLMFSKTGIYIIYKHDIIMFIHCAGYLKFSEINTFYALINT